MSIALLEAIGGVRLRDFAAEVVEVKTVTKHPAADRLDCVTFNDYDWVVISGRVEDVSGSFVPRYTPGDRVIYIPIDAVLPPELECYLFPPESKIKLEKSRVRTLKLRGCISQGMSVDITDQLSRIYPKLANAKLGDDVTEILGITKYEPPISEIPTKLQGSQTPRLKANPLFTEYNDIKNFKYFANIFEGEDVYVSEKLHGTSARYANLPRRIRKDFSSITGTLKTILELIKHRLGLLPTHEFCFGSRRVQLQQKPKEYKGFYDENVYAIVAQKEQLASKLPPGYSLYGEIVGCGIQKNYTYGCAPGEYKFYAYDVKGPDGKFLPFDEFVDFCSERNISAVPVLYVGRWNREHIDSLRFGDSTIGGQKIREGVVVKSHYESISPLIGRKVLKWVSDDYLLKDNSDFH